jgi:hypothetical protein
MGLRCWKDTQTGISFSIFFFICKKKKKWTGTPGMDGPTSFRERFEDEKKIKKKMQKNVPEAYCVEKIKKQGKRRTERANGKQPDR